MMNELHEAAVSINKQVANIETFNINGTEIVAVKRENDSPYPVYDACVNTDSIGSVSQISEYMWRIFGNDDRIDHTAFKESALEALILRA